MKHKRVKVKLSSSVFSVLSVQAIEGKTAHLVSTVSHEMLNLPIVPNLDFYNVVRKLSHELT